MEMDMDVESPVDEPSPIRSGSIPAQRGPSIRDFPPLTNTPAHRAYSSPAPQTPPPGAVNNKTRETELDLKEKAIQEMRRKIALAEARRRAKQPSGGSVTPRQTEQTPELREPETSRPLTAEQVPPTDSPDRQNRSSPQLTPETSSLGVPKRSETLHPDPLRRAERRGRIVSLDLPRVESTLEEKLDRLKRLQEEETQLRAEIEANVAEKQKLTSELEELGTATPAQSPQPNGLGSGDGSGNPSRRTEVMHSIANNRQKLLFHRPKGLHRISSPVHRLRRRLCPREAKNPAKSRRTKLDPLRSNRLEGHAPTRPSESPGLRVLLHALALVKRTPMTTVSSWQGIRLDCLCLSQRATLHTLSRMPNSPQQGSK